MEIDAIIYTLLWMGFLTFEIVMGVRVARIVIKRIKKWHTKRTLVDLK